MIEPLTLTVAELAARWKLSGREALERGLPTYFYFDGLVFDFSDKWHRANGGVGVAEFLLQADQVGIQPGERQQIGQRHIARSIGQAGLQARPGQTDAWKARRLHGRRRARRRHAGSGRQIRCAGGRRHRD